MPKIKYGLKNCYYAKATISTSDGSATYATPVKWAGAVNLSMDKEGDQEIFWADNIAYFVSENNGGYSGSFESALIPESFRKDILGEYLDTTDQVLVEVVNPEPVHFAFLFQFENDVSNTKHVLYNCVASRASVSSQTKEASVTPVTETVDIKAMPVYCTTLSKDIVKAKTGDSVSTTADAAWFTSVWMPA